jgi:hypothetical protein
MCTVSWLRQDGGYQLLCNRDERNTRRPALSPRVFEHRGVKFIAPTDGDHRGSWIGVNQFGLSLCLLNRYGAQPAAGARISRGLLLVELMDSTERAEVQDRIVARDLSRFEPFTLLALEPDKKALHIRWTGRRRAIQTDGEAEMPLISSSYDELGALESRRQCFERSMSGSGGPTADLLFKFHGSHEPARGPYSPCMHRDDAQTVSFSWIKVAPDGIQFGYHPLSPCSLWPDARRAEIQIEMART